MIYKLRQPDAAKPLFGDWQETILWSCLQGVMGAVYGDDSEKPRSAAALLGDFCFLAGTPNAELSGFLLDQYRTAVKGYSGDAAKERRKPGPAAGSGDCGCKAMRAAAAGREALLLIPQNEAWAQLIGQQYGPAARRMIRYAFLKESSGFDVQSLRRMTAPFSPEEKRGAKPCNEEAPCDEGVAGFVLRPIDSVLYEHLRASGWGRDLVAQYPDADAWKRLGIGVAAIRSADGVAVAGASSYSRYLDGIEIEVDTKKEYRRRGLARACAAQLMLDCLERGLYPSWDAHNPQSARLAEQLGYRMDQPYPAYEVALPVIQQR